MKTLKQMLKEKAVLSESTYREVAEFGEKFLYRMVDNLFNKIIDAIENYREITGDRNLDTALLNLLTDDWLRDDTPHDPVSGEFTAKHILDGMKPNDPRKMAAIKAAFDFVKNQVDPSGGSYTKWLFESYALTNIRNWEDWNRAREAVTWHFERRRNRWFRTIEDGKKWENIDNFVGIAQLETFIRKHKKARKSLSLKAHAEQGGVTMIYQGEEGYVLIPNTVEASCDLFQGSTGWCTARPENEFFDQYKEEGTLYVIADKAKKEKYQLHFESRQFFDSTDNPIGSAEELPAPRLMESLAAYIRSNLQEEERFLYIQPRLLENPVPTGNQIAIAFLAAGIEEKGTMGLAIDRIKTPDDAVIFSNLSKLDSMVDSFEDSDLEKIGKFVTPTNVEEVVRSGGLLVRMVDYLTDDAIAHRLATYGEWSFDGLKDRLTVWGLHGPQLRRCLNIMKDKFE